MEVLAEDIRRVHIPGYEGYAASEDGQIWTCLRHAGKLIRGAVITNQWRPLRQKVKREGYREVRLRKQVGEYHCLYVHRLILEAFVGPGNESQEVCHGDGDRSNNSLANLRWGTRKENHDDKRRHGTVARGSKIGTAVHTENEVKEIVEQYRLLPMSSTRNRKANGTVKALASKYGMSVPSLLHIVNGPWWQHVKTA